MKTMDLGNEDIQEFWKRYEIYGRLLVPSDVPVKNESMYMAQPS